MDTNRPGPPDDDRLAQRRGPLAGVVVLDITRVVAGPYCAMLLADMGATVLKVENPSDPDYARGFPPFAGTARKSAFFTQFNRNKQGITLDLKTDEGRALLRALVRKAHVLIENFRPGTMEKLGVGYDELARENPALVYTAISGFGRTGPNSSRPAYDNTGQAAGGLWSMNGYADRPPVRVGTIIGDLSASLYAALGTLAALREAERTGRGQVVDVSQQDSVLSMTENAVVRYTLEQDVAGPLGNDHPFVRPYGQFPCKDGHVFFGGYTDKFWRLSCQIFGTPHLADDPEIDTMDKRFSDAVYTRRILPILDQWFLPHTKAELEQMAGDRVPLTAVKTIAEVVEDPHIAARQMIVDVPVDDRMVRMFGNPVKLSGLGLPQMGAAPDTGADNAAVYGALLGLDRAEVDRLRAAGVL
ncbi:Crotonobetainyl-CoA:carnitine CoA-transferase CaiB [Gemmobacter megaterium]|uniref:Crotonobetainyl-CoA:carnitine CoA-transferase CaiB n=1 Tax=Gemmobacter megaterium TaxID=1086013 RepID=A0A1N7N4Q4_9RHOB|nr:CoA transferase [Gemmobacter megaterium]GGE12974.1 formyl-CoA transferase [Gemmobacter megaterium]SIS93141.1 Crotonobetainyl-CoA:carnitine CoA-transferase CaiB [Gemmobacter megaterium]